MQPHSGAQANRAVYFTLLKPGDPCLVQSRARRQLTPAADDYSGKFYTIGVRRRKDTSDRHGPGPRLARQHREMIVAGGSAFPRAIDFAPFGEIAREVGAALMADIAHPAGLVAAGLHPSPVGIADFVTTTTHKTLRGPRGGMVMCRTAHAQALDKTVMPGVQGGPLMHVIAGKRRGLSRALTPAWRATSSRCAERHRAGRGADGARSAAWSAAAPTSI